MNEKKVFITECYPKNWDNEGGYGLRFYFEDEKNINVESLGKRTKYFSFKNPSLYEDLKELGLNENNHIKGIAIYIPNFMTEKFELSDVKIDKASIHNMF